MLERLTGNAQTAAAVFMTDDPSAARRLLGEKQVFRDLETQGTEAHFGFKPRAAGRLVQECGKGLVEIKIDGERLLLALPEPQFREPSQRGRGRSGRLGGRRPARSDHRCRPRLVHCPARERRRRQSPCT